MQEYAQEMSSFQSNLANIQKAASELVTLQQNIKLSGKLSEIDQKLYAENLERLGVSAQNLAHLQKSGNQDDFRLLFEGPLSNRFQDENKHEVEEETGNYEDNDPIRDEENVGEENGSESSESKPDTDDSVQVNVPNKDASVAEAKPVGKTFIFS